MFLIHVFYVIFYHFENSKDNYNKVIVKVNKVLTGVRYCRILSGVSAHYNVKTMMCNIHFC